MNRDEAKDILLLYRPGMADEQDPEIAQALEVARRDPELGRWFENHCQFQQAMRAKFREIGVPEHLKAALLAEPKVIRPQAWWRQPAWIAVAAAIVLLAVLFPLHPRPAAHDRFANFREMMVSIALKDYRMDWETNDQARLRQLLGARGAPADYQVPPRLAQLKLTGGAALTWRSNPVSMVCFDQGNKQMFFLFVMDNVRVKDPPPLMAPELIKVSSYQTASWRSGGKTYILVGPDEPQFRNYL